MDFGTPLGSNIVPWSAIFSQFGHPASALDRTGSLLEPTWARFGAENVPRTHFHRSGVVVG